MQKLVIFGVVTGMLFLFTPATQAQSADEVTRLRKENELLKKENELLKKEVELLKKEVANKPGAGKPGGGAKVTIDDVEYEFVSLKMNGVKCELKIAVTSKKGDKKFPLVMQRYTLIGDDGTQYTSGAGAANGQIELPLPEGVRVLVPVTFNKGPLPAGMKTITAIQLGNRSKQNPEAQPVILKGNFPVEGR